MAKRRRKAKGKVSEAGLKRIKMVLAKKKAAKIQRFTAFAIDVINGKQVFEEKPPAPKRGFVKKSRAIERAMKRNPRNINAHFSKVFGASLKTVALCRARLVEAGEIPDVSFSERLKYKKRGPNARPVLSKYKRTRTVNALLPVIRSKAKQLFQDNKEMFAVLKMKQSDIEQKLQRWLETRLEAFNLERMRGRDQTKLKRFCEMEISLALGNIKWSAEQRYKTALKKKTPEKAVAESVQKSKAGLVRYLNALSKQYELNPLKRAVLLGLAAEIPMAETGRKIDLSKERVRQIKNDLRAFPSFEKRLGEIKKALALEADIVKW